MRPVAFVTRVALVGGLAAGTLDILDPIVVHGLQGTSPVRILQSVASGLLGRAAFTGGAATAALGLLLHFFIAITAATVYAMTSLRLAWLTRRPVPSGIAFGLAVWAFMRFLVLPLSAARTAPIALDWMLVNALAIHVLGVGLPIAFAARAFAAARAHS